jgi:phospho-N-acetylmuramoyl-pentapeptide-transferase
MVAASIGFLTTSARTLPALTIFGTMLACGAIGFLDDLTKLRHRRSLGLSGRLKMLFLIGIAAAVGVAAHHQHLRHNVFVPIIDQHVPLGWGFYVLVFLVIAGAANAVNLTDGIDGLAAGTAIIALFTLTAMAVTVYIRSGTSGHRIPTRLDAAYIGAAVIGAAIGFLWFNAFPAEVFMGDTGSMAMGGAIGAMAVFLQIDLLLLLVGGIFVIEALSVIAQVLSFKWWGRRIFLMAPLHHHFEMKAWSETKIMVRFWIITGVLCAAGFALFYKYYTDFYPLR